MRTALRSAFLNPQPWSAPKRSSSRALPVITDDDEESGSTTCELPDSTGPGLNECPSSSGDERWSLIGTGEYDRAEESGEQPFLELSEEAQDSSPAVARSGAQTQQQQRLVPVFPAAFGSSRVSKRGPPPRLTTLAADAATAAPVAGDGGDGSRWELRTSPNASLAPMATWPPSAATTPTSPHQYDGRRSPYGQPPLSPALAPPPLPLPAVLGRERMRSLSRSKSGGHLTVSPASPLLGSTRGVRSPGTSAAGAFGGGGDRDFGPELSFARASASSILDLSGSGAAVAAGAAATADTDGAAARAAIAHSAPPNLQPGLRQPPGLQPTPQQPPLQAASVGPFSGPVRVRANTQMHLKAFTASASSQQQQQSRSSSNAALRPQKLQQLQPWWGLPPPVLGTASGGGGGAAVAARLGAVVTPVSAAAVATAAAAAAAITTPANALVFSSAAVPLAMTTAAPRAATSAHVIPRQLLSPQSPAQSHRGPRDSELPQKQQHQQPQQPPQPNLAAAADSSPLPQNQNQRHYHQFLNTSSAPQLRLSESWLPGASQPPAAAATNAESSPPPARPLLTGRAAAMPPARTASAARTARQSAPSLGRMLQLPGLTLQGGGGADADASTGAYSAASGAAAAAAVAAAGESHMQGVGVVAAGAGAGGPIAAEVPAAPELALRPPRWLKPAAFQVTEQLRSGRLQELVDRLATVSCPTFLDLGGLEFSGHFTPPVPPSLAGGCCGAGAAADHGNEPVSAAATVAAAAVAALGAVVAGPPRHQTLRASLNGIGVVSPLGRYPRTAYAHSGSGGGAIAVGGGGGGGAAFWSQQVVRIPAGQHITINNGTLLLTADQCILVGPGASLTLKGVEVLGCSRETARQSAAARRRALSMAAAAAAASASPAVAQNAAAAAIAAVTSTAASGYSKLVRRTSSPGRTTREAGMYGSGSMGRRVSVSDSTEGGKGGGGGGGGIGLPPVRRRAPSTTGTTPSYILAVPLPGQDAAATVMVQEMVDPKEYVDSHGLVEIVGGYARISNSRLWPGRCQLALCVSDGGGCSLSYSTAGACCAAGIRSCLVSEQTTYDGGAAGCVSALDGARLGLTDCVLQHPEGAPKVPTAAAEDGAGATAIAGGSCELGVEARGSGTLAVLTNCDVTNGGVAVAQGARLHLQSTRVSDARGYGMLALDPGTALYVRDCRVDDSGNSAIAASDGAAVRVADSTLAGSSAAGVAVLPYSGTTSAAVAAAVVAAAAPPRSAITLLRCDVSANAGHGALVAGGGFLAVADSVLYNNLGCGVAVDGESSIVSAVGMRAIRNEGHGVRSAGGAGAVLTRCCLLGNGRDGVSIETPGSRGHLIRCESRENRESGLCVTGGASAELSYTRLAANQHDGLAVGGDGSLATAQSCVFNGNVAKGAVVCMGGAAELTECAVHCNGSKSVQVSDGDSRLVLGRGCSLDRKPAATSGGTLVQQ